MSEQYRSVFNARFLEMKSIFIRGELQTDIRTDGRTDGRTDEQTDRQHDWLI